MKANEKFEYRKALIELVVSIISTLLVLWTLFEMQADRNAAYRPDLSFSDAEVAISWEGTPTEDSNESSYYSLLNSLSESYDFNTQIELKLYNIGVGTAKDVILKWDHKANIDAFSEAFSNYDDVRISLKGNMLHIESPSYSWATGVGPDRIAEFMLSSTDEYCTIQFPYEYYFFIQELLYRKPIDNTYPTLYLSITYSDVQNKTYTKNISASIENSLYASNPNGDGLCLYNLHFSEENPMLSSNLFHLDSDSLSAISAFAAVVTSIISIIITLIYSKKQNEHNRNSVRPIAAIKFADYENRIAVEIENVGTGPLLISRLRFTQGSIEKDTLLGLMPRIDQYWSTYTEAVDGWALPINGVITLIEIGPDNDETRKLIRESLSTITASLDYTDIYSTKFHTERSFEFFARHY